METSVLIAGAGPTGLAAALALTSHQIPVTIIDPVIERSPFSKALAFNPRSQELLEASGVTAAIRREAREITGVRLHNSKKTFLAINFDCDFPGDALKHDWALADLRVDESAWRSDAFNKAHLIREGKRFVFVLPVSPGILRIVSDDEAVLDDLPALVRETTPQEVVWQSQFRISHRQVPHYQHGNLFLAGDAAHIHSPVGGRGMNMGIEDAFCLADCIGQETPEDYHRIRHAYGKQAIRLIKAQTRFATNHSLFTNLATQLLGPILFRSRKVQTEFARRNLGLQHA
ncbi:Rifampicin monooxygenase (RIFMO), partial [Durusdinium trenchii]